SRRPAATTAPPVGCSAATGGRRQEPPTSHGSRVVGQQLLEKNALVARDPDWHGGVRPRLELHEDVEVGRFLAVRAPELPDDVAVAALVLVGDKGGVDELGRAVVDVLDPRLGHDLEEEILDHAAGGEEQAVAEVVLSHDFSAGTLPWSPGRCYSGDPPSTLIVALISVSNLPISWSSNQKLPMAARRCGCSCQVRRVKSKKYGPDAAHQRLRLAEAVRGLEQPCGPIAFLDGRPIRPNGPGDSSPGMRPQADSLGFKGRHDHAACKAAGAFTRSGTGSKRPLAALQAAG